MQCDIVEPSVTIEHITPNALQVIENAGRTCYKSVGRGNPGKFVQMIKRRGHFSVLEHATAGLRFVCDRGISHELVRHRIGVAYSQESTRYCNYSGRVQVIEPPGLSDAQHIEWADTVEVAAKSYDRLLELGTKPEIARSVLPTCLKTEIVCTANFREWLHIFELRCAPAAHPQMRALMIDARILLRREVPEVFGEMQELNDKS